MKNIVIIGNGIAGITAARNLRKCSDADILVISGESDYFYSRTALMYIYMGHMKFEHTKPYEDSFWKKNRIELKKAWVNELDTNSKNLLLDSGESINYDKLILALGSQSRKFGWPGQDLIGVSGLYSLQDLNYIEEKTKRVERAVIVGGGLIGIELAEMLHSRNIKVTFLVREENFWDGVLPFEEAEMINREIVNHDIDLRLSTELKEIDADEKGRVCAVITDKGERIEASFVGLTVGVQANINLAKEAGIECGKGVLVDEFLQTNVEDVFAIGDCVELRRVNAGRRSIEQVWYTGRMMGETVVHNLEQPKVKYNPGNWFNSAKFFNIEYQTYGVVKTKPQEGEAHFVWQEASKNVLLRLAYHKKTQSILGINVFGMRMRHEIWDQWLQEKKNVSGVIKELKIANFDPEFFPRYESKIQEAFKDHLSNHKTTEAI